MPPPPALTDVLAWLRQHAGAAANDLQPDSRRIRRGDGTEAFVNLQLRTMERPEVAELGTLYGEEACSSSTMPNRPMTKGGWCTPRTSIAVTGRCSAPWAASTEAVPQER